MWIIDKQFSFCYGHRVWSQKLEHEFCETGDYQCKCRHLHGHEGLVHVFLSSNNLERGMVTDFKHLGWLKNFLDNHIDHKFIIDKNDPYFTKMVGWVSKVDNKEQVLLPRYQTTGDYFHDFIPICVPETTHIAGYNIDCTNLTGPQLEYYEGFFIVDFIPTSENLSKWLFDCVDAKMQRLGINVEQVDWFETPKSRSSYRRSQSVSEGCCGGNC